VSVALICYFELLLIALDIVIYLKFI
jgi:hypothetical protein